MNTILPFPADQKTAQDIAQRELELAARHPISRWYVCPLVGVMADWLADTRCRPTHVTLLGAVLVAAAVVTLANGFPLWGTLLFWLAWCCDRLDGTLARTQQATSRWGAWLDANLDEAADIALHAGCAACAAIIYAASWPWFLFAAFVGGKYLWQYGIRLEAEITAANTRHVDAAEPLPAADSGVASSPKSRAIRARLRSLYNLPGNADIRAHILIVTLACARPEIELVFVASYFGLRAIARGVLVQRRLTSPQVQAEPAETQTSDVSSTKEAA